MKIGSLFTGIGGFDLGFERSGLQTVWQVEIDKNCNEVLTHHWPHVERFADVKQVGKHNLAPVDLISGGFPCQDLSVAGRRAGLAGGRSGLWFKFARIVEEMAPEWVVVENVPGLFSSNGGEDFAVIVRTLELFGYCVAWRVLDSQYFGVPQRRRRVFIIGSLGGTGSVKVLFESEGGEGHIAEGKEAWQRIAAPVKASSPSRRRGGSWPIAEEFVIASTLNSSGNDGGFRTEPGEHIVFDWQSGGDVWLNVSDKRTTALSQRQTPAVARTLSSTDPTQGGPGDRLPMTPNRMGVRRLTPTECERLQGFPDGWTEGLSDSARYRCLGNAVTVNVAEWIGRRIAGRTWRP